jgi:hypothetical protein
MQRFVVSICIASALISPPAMAEDVMANALGSNVHELCTMGSDVAGAWCAGEDSKHGKNAIETVRHDRPAAYLKLIASLIPKDLNFSISAYVSASISSKLAIVRFPGPPN